MNVKQRQIAIAVKRENGDARDTKRRGGVHLLALAVLCESRRSLERWTRQRHTATGVHRERLFTEALESYRYLTETQADDWPLSFANVCKLHCLDADHLRDEILGSIPEEVLAWMK